MHEGWTSTRMGLKGIPAANGVIPFFHTLRHVIRMQCRFPSSILGLLKVHAGETMVALIEVIVVAVRLGGPDDLRHGLCQETILIGSLPQPIVGSGQFFGALQHAQLQIAMSAAQLVHRVAALLVNFRER